MAQLIPIVPLALVVVFLTVGIGIRGWLQWRRHGTTGIVLFADGAAGHLRDLALLGLPLVLLVHAGAEWLAPRALSPLLLPLPVTLAHWLRAAGVLLVLGATALMFAAQLSLGASWRVGIDRTSRPGLVVDGDQVRDYALAAIHGDSVHAALSGKVAVYAGGRRGELLAELGGELPASKFGFALAGGDFDGDGHADVAVGSPLHSPDPGLYQQGAVRVFMGPGLEDGPHLDASAALSLKGLGWALAAGDVSGDGLDDLVLSSTSAGRVLVFFGSRDFRPALDAPDAVLRSAAAGFGKTLAVLGDLNGDGARELAIGAPNNAVRGARDTGSVFIVSVQRGREPLDLDASPASARRLDGLALFDRFGAAITSLRDRDGDGVDEVAIGAPLADHEDKDMVGKVFVVSGKALAGDGPLHAQVLHGSDKHGAFGAAIADGPEGKLWIGAPRARADHGAALLVDLQRAQHAALGGEAAQTTHEGEHDAH